LDGNRAASVGFVLFSSQLNWLRLDGAALFISTSHNFLLTALIEISSVWSIIVGEFDREHGRESLLALFSFLRYV
jgi:hypothetical protein